MVHWLGHLFQRWPQNELLSLYVYVYYIYAELRIGNCRFGSGEAAERWLDVLSENGRLENVSSLCPFFPAM